MVLSGDPFLKWIYRIKYEIETVLVNLVPRPSLLSPSPQAFFPLSQLFNVARRNGTFSACNIEKLGESAWG